MTQDENLDWLADEEGNLRPEVGQALAEHASRGEMTVPRENLAVGFLGRWALRGLVAAAGIWLVISLLEWVVLGCFVLGLCVRMRQWAERPHRGGQRGRGEARREQTSVRRPAEEIPPFGRGRVPRQDPDPALAMGEE